MDYLSLLILGENLVVTGYNIHSIPPKSSMISRTLLINTLLYYQFNGSGRFADSIS
jgi:hypothetical protein